MDPDWPSPATISRLPGAEVGGTPRLPTERASVADGCLRGRNVAPDWHVLRDDIGHAYDRWSCGQVAGHDRGRPGLIKGLAGRACRAAGRGTRIGVGRAADLDGQSPRLNDGEHESRMRVPSRGSCRG